MEKKYQCLKASGFAIPIDFYKKSHAGVTIIGAVLKIQSV